MDINNKKLQWEMDILYNKLNGKLDRLQTQLHTPTPQPKRQQTASFPRTISLTSIHFTDEEQKLLDLGLQYSLENPMKTSWEHLVMETEHAMKLLDEKLQNPFRILAAKKLKQTNTQHKTPKHHTQTTVTHPKTD